MGATLEDSDKNIRLLWKMREHIHTENELEGMYEPNTPQGERHDRY